MGGSPSDYINDKKDKKMYSVTFRPFTSLEIFVITLYYDQPVQEATTHYLSRGGGGGGLGGRMILVVTE